MKVKILGGGREVGRSAFLLNAKDQILLDYGVKLSGEKSEAPMEIKTNLSAAIISHAHLDHSGYLPTLFNENHYMSYMTTPTLEISKVLWNDSIKIAGYEGLPSPYTKNEINRIEKFTFPTQYKRELQITKNTSLEFFDAGHILGSAMVKLSIEKNLLLYTGDFKPSDTRLFKGADEKVGEIDFLIIESCYGDRNHPPRKKVEKEFAEMVQDTIDRGGFALIPAFAVGRSQEVIDILYEYKINAPIFFDGMGQKIAKITLQYPEYLKDPKLLGKALHSVEWVERKGKAKVLQQPSVIVATAGMMQGGAILQYFKKTFNDKASSLFFTGYQVEGTPGRTLLDKGIFEFEGRTVKVKNQIKKFDFSAHASQTKMLEAIKKWNPKKIIIVHGDPEVEEIFKEKIKEMGFDVVAPKNGESIELK